MERVCEELGLSMEVKQIDGMCGYAYCQSFSCDYTECGLIFGDRRYFVAKHSSLHVTGAAQGYFISEGVLIRKWTPQAKAFLKEPVIQVVVPTPFRSMVNNMANCALPHPAQSQYGAG
ncbi:hypothetical protein ROHU_027155 [Labeo rohita]|uniref:Uncharacterized protein n=1 Tax=Labeo rohita TaxID=84645 RepID=A0A498M8K2_LABRO|nr:hypothetical protein ROHU_027155 [Labeo rohita]